MKARFNYDLTEVFELLSVARVLHRQKDENHEITTQAIKRTEAESHRDLERAALIERVDQLTRLMEAEREKARGAMSDLNIARAFSLLRPQ